MQTTTGIIDTANNRRHNALNGEAREGAIELLRIYNDLKNTVGATARLRRKQIRQRQVAHSALLPDQFARPPGPDLQISG